MEELVQGDIQVFISFFCVFFSILISQFINKSYKWVSKIAGNESGLAAAKGFVELKEFYWMWFN